MITVSGGGGMKFSFIPDKSREEVVIYAKEKTTLIEQIENLCKEQKNEILGYIDDEIVKLNPEDVYCFIVENNHIYAITDKEKYLVRERLYILEDMIGDGFIKINQSCLANVKAISKFDVSLSCALKVVFLNGYSDYVSRRNIKKVKERFGVK